MSIFKRGGVYWYEFVFNGERLRESTKQGNQNVARHIEAARRSALAKGEAGIIERPAAPTLKDYAKQFEREIETVCRDKPATITFYKEKLRRLLAHEPLACKSLDAITESTITEYRQTRSRQVSRYGRPIAAASINRELATLRRLLRFAADRKVIIAAPKVKLLRGERTRDFVLSHAQEKGYLEACPEPLRDLATLILDTGLRVGEARTLLGKNVYLTPAGDARFGYLRIGEGKTRYARRNVSLTARANALLAALIEKHGSGVLFPGKEGSPFLGTSLNHQHEHVRKDLKLPKDFVIHSLRHTMLTRLGEAGVDAFTIMRIAGHSSVTISQRYVHPSPESLERAFEKLENLNANAKKMALVPTKSPTREIKRNQNASQVVVNKRMGP